jgi:hypothetical protein
MLSHQLVKDTDAQQGELYRLVPSDNSGKFHVKDLRGGKYKPTYEELKKKHLSHVRFAARRSMSIANLPQRGYRNTGVCSASDADRWRTHTKHLYHALGRRCKNHLRDTQDLGSEL